MEYEYKKSNSGYYLVEISGEGCAGCEAVNAEINEALSSLPEYKFARLDDWRDGEEIASFQIEKVPAIILLCNGVEFARVYGFQPAEILQLWIEDRTEKYKKYNS